MGFGGSSSVIGRGISSPCRLSCACHPRWKSTNLSRRYLHAPELPQYGEFHRTNARKKFAPEAPGREYLLGSKPDLDVSPHPVINPGLRTGTRHRAGAVLINLRRNRILR